MRPNSGKIKLVLTPEGGQPFQHCQWQEGASLQRRSVSCQCSRQMHAFVQAKIGMIAKLPFQGGLDQRVGPAGLFNPAGLSG
jgi:hypothetical protein